MKNLFLLLILTVLLTACSITKNSKIDNNSETESLTTSSPYMTSTITTVTTTNIPITTTAVIIMPSYKEINKEIEEYFRMFYANNKNYSLEATQSSLELSTTSDIIIGYFDGDSLVSLGLEYYGDMSTAFTTYYIINENLIYVVGITERYALYGNSVSMDEYFIINGNVWIYSEKIDDFVECNKDPDSYSYSYLFKEENKIFEQVKYELLGDRPFYTAQNAYTLPTEWNLFDKFNDVKKSYFRNFYAENHAYDYKQFKVNIPDFKSEKINGWGIFDDTDLRKLRLRYWDETIFTSYDYYIISNNYIYVIVKNEEYKKELNILDISKDYYEEFFIVDRKVMKYDLEKQDLIESADDTDILTYFNIAKESIED